MTTYVVPDLCDSSSESAVCSQRCVGGKPTKYSVRGSARVAIDMIIIKILCPRGNKDAVWLVKKFEPQSRHEFLDHVTADHIDRINKNGNRVVLVRSDEQGPFLGTGFLSKR